MIVNSMNNILTNSDKLRLKNSNKMIIPVIENHTYTTYSNIDNLL